MITAVDTNVLLDVFMAGEHGVASRGALHDCLTDGAVVASDVVWGEIAAAFPSEPAAVEAMERVGIDFSPINRAAALRAGSAWRAYRARGGKRGRLVADFLIGAHAVVLTDRLLTRDRGFYRAYFRGLRVLDPSVHT